MWESAMTVDVHTLSQWRLGITREVEALRQQIAPLEEAIQRKEEELLVVDRLLGLQGDVPEESTRTPLQGPGRDGRKGFVEAAADVLRRQGEPLHYRALHAKVAAEKVHVRGRDPAANLLAHISRDDRFVWVQRGTYGLSEWGGSSRPKRKRTSKRRRSRR